jgi:DNA invertase Pin-like site-specific DNA recombinase
MTIYGNARVSTDGQTLEAEVASLKAVGAEKVFSEKQSGAKTERAALAKALAALGAGDVLLISWPTDPIGQTPHGLNSDGRRLCDQVIPTGIHRCFSKSFVRAPDRCLARRPARFQATTVLQECVGNVAQ